MPLSRRSLLVGSALSGLGISTSAGKSFGKDLQKVTVRLDWHAGADHGALYMAAAKGLYRDEGLDVSIQDGAGSAAAIQVVAAGNEMIGLASYAQIAQASTKGITNLVGICGIMQKAPDAIVALKTSGITKPSDLNGKRWGLVPTDSGARIFPAFAQKHGINLDSIRKVSLSHGTIFTTLLNGDVDFICAWASPDAFKIAKQKPINPPMVMADYGVNTLGTGIFVRRDTIETKREVVAAFMRATSKGAMLAASDPAGAIAAIMAARPDTDQEILKIEMDNLGEYLHTPASAGKPYGWVAPDDVRSTLELLTKYFEMPATADGSKLFTNEFISG